MHLKVENDFLGGAGCPGRFGHSLLPWWQHRMDGLDNRRLGDAARLLELHGAAGLPKFICSRAGEQSVPGCRLRNRADQGSRAH